MFRTLCIPLVCLPVAAFALLLCGCGGGSHAVTTPVVTTPTTTTPTTTTAPNIAAPRTFGSLQFTLSADKAAYALTDPVSLTFTVKNVGQQPVKFLFGSSKRYDVKAFLNNTLVYQESTGAGYGGAIEIFSLQPGESRAFTDTLNTPNDKPFTATPGTYTIKMWLAVGSLDDVVVLGADQEANLAANTIQITLQP